MQSQIAEGYLSDEDRLEAEMQTAFEDQLQIIKELPGANAENPGTGGATVMASDAFALVDNYQHYAVDTQGAAASDDLKNITGTVRDGAVIFIRPFDSARNIVVKHAAGGAGQIYTLLGRDITLKNTGQYLALIARGAAFYQLAIDSSLIVDQLAGARVASTLTVASGACTPDRAVHLLGTGGTAQDLATLNTTSLEDGRFVFLRGSDPTTAGQVVTIKHGTGNITLANAADFVLNTVFKAICLRRSGSGFVEVFRTGVIGGGEIPALGSPLQGLRVNAGGTALEFADLASSGGDGFGGNGSRALPTSGTLSGDYYHDGNWTATGALTIPSGTRIFARNFTTFDFSTFNHVVQTRPNSGGKGRGTSGNYGSAVGMGSGPGIATSDNRAITGPGGPGFGGRGGRGGSYGDNYAPGGSSYSPREFFGGTGGNSGMHYTSTVAAAVDGGNAGGSLYLELKANSGGTVTLGNINLNGANGTNAPDYNYTGSAGGTGGCFVARIRGTATLPSGRTISVNGGSGGGVGSGGTANAAAGGASAGVIDIEATTWTNSGTLQANGGAAGSGGSYTATAGENSTPKALSLGYDPCSFF